MDLINENLGEHMLEWAGLDANKVVVRAMEEVDQLLTVTYRPDILEIRCEYPNETENYRPKVTANKEVVFLEKFGDERRTEDLAEHILIDSSHRCESILVDQPLGLTANPLKAN